MTGNWTWAAPVLLAVVIVLATAFFRWQKKAGTKNFSFPPPAPLSRDELVLLLIPLTVHLALAFHHIGREPVSIMEDTSIRTMNLFSGDLLSVFFNGNFIRYLEGDGHQPLHVILGYWLVPILGPGDIEHLGAFRGFSAVCNTLALFFIYRFVRIYIGKPFSLAVLGLLSVHPLYVYYSRQFECYALLNLFNSAGLYLFFTMGGSRSRQAMFTVVLISAFFTHYFSTVIFTGELLFCFYLLIKRRLFYRPFFEAAAVFGAVAAVWSPHALRSFLESPFRHGIPGYMPMEFFWRYTLHKIRIIFGFSTVPDPYLGWLVAALLSLLALAVFAALTGKERRFATSLLIILIATAFGFFALFEYRLYEAKSTYLLIRHFITLPALILTILFLRAPENLGRRAVPWVAASAMAAAMMLHQSWSIVKKPSNPDFSAVFAQLATVPDIERSTVITPIPYTNLMQHFSKEYPFIHVLQPSSVMFSDYPSRTPEEYADVLLQSELPRIHLWKKWKYFIILFTDEKLFGLPDTDATFGQITVERVKKSPRHQLVREFAARDIRAYVFTWKE